MTPTAGSQRVKSSRELGTGGLSNLVTIPMRTSGINRQVPVRNNAQPIRVRSVVRSIATSRHGMSLSHARFPIGSCIIRVVQTRIKSASTRYRNQRRGRAISDITGRRAQNTKSECIRYRNRSSERGTNGTIARSPHAIRSGCTR